MDEHNKSVVKQFLEMQWAAFEQHCQEFEVDAEEVVTDLDDNA